jgi:hypothetical protein
MYQIQTTETSPLHHHIAAKQQLLVRSLAIFSKVPEVSTRIAVQEKNCNLVFCHIRVQEFNPRDSAYAGLSA